MLLEAANFEPLTILRTSRAAAAAHRGVDALGEGRRPVRRRSRRRSTRRSCSSSSPARAGPGHADVHAALPEPPRRPAPSRARERGPRRSRSRTTEQRQLLAAARLRGRRRLGRDRAHVARARRHARDRPRRGGRPLPPRRRPARRSRAAAHVRGRLTREQRLRRHVEDVLVGLGFDEAYTWSLVGRRSGPGQRSGCPSR